jgi:MFS family permease
MDNLGAVIGPALASLFLIAYPDRYRTLFALTIVPGAIAVLLIFLVPQSEPGRESGTGPNAAAVSKSNEPSRATSSEPSGAKSDVEALPPRFYAFMGVLTLFMLGNSTDAFLLLRLTDAAGGARYVPLMWAGIHVVKTAVSVVGGAWSDRVGRRTVIAIGWLTYAIVYAGFAISKTLPALLTWFMIYGFYFGFAEGTEKALVADLAPAPRRGAAFGYYNAVSGLGALTASVVFGAIWTAYGSSAAFAVGTALALAATAALFMAVPDKPL